MIQVEALYHELVFLYSFIPRKIKIDITVSQITWGMNKKGENQVHLPYLQKSRESSNKKVPKTAAKTKDNIRIIQKVLFCQSKCDLEIGFISSVSILSKIDFFKSFFIRILKL